MVTSLITTCLDGQTGWQFSGLFNMRIRFTGSYGTQDSNSNNASMVSLNDNDPNTVWSLKTVNKENTGNNTINFLYAYATNKNDIYVGEVLDTLTNFNVYTTITLVSYQFLFCGDVNCCCCPIPRSLPDLISSKLRIQYA